MTDTEPDQPQQLTTSQSTVGGVRLVALHGELDQNTGAYAGAALSPPTDGTSPRTIADLTDLTFMDSSGINTLIAAHRAAEAAGGWLRVAGAQPTVLRVMQIVGIDTLISCHPTVRHALEQ
ncbi:STAS domain-containing protein [Streptomyces sp. NPDC051105]|uniref:STAS domain-containing protein n=1 Tax=Streptomyces sp. NPDC051105 TaxID=3154843 RepID=UPI003441D1E4